MADDDQDRGEGWLVLIYRVPSEPSRLRSTVWRRIKSLGAIYLQNSAAALPAGTGQERALRKLRSEILDMGGTAVLLSCTVLAGATEVMQAFQAARNDEYEEIVDRCEDFLAQVKKEHVAEHFTYAELEENEVDLAKLQNWFARRRQSYRAGQLRAGAGELRRPGLRGGSRHSLTLFSPSHRAFPLVTGGTFHRPRVMAAS